MKKWIVLAVVLVLVLGGGVATIFGLKGKDTDDTSASTGGPSEVETALPYILAKEKLVLVEGGSANTNACAFDIENATIQYLSSDTNIAEVDSFGNVFAIGVGSTFVQNYFVLNNVEYSHKTNIIVLPTDIESTVVLLDEDNKETNKIEVGEKYTLKLTTTVNMDYYEISLVASDGAKTTGTYDKQENTFSCEIYFETQNIEKLGFKLTLNADCGTQEYMTQTLSFLDTYEEQTTQENPETESEDINNDKTAQTEQETTTETPSEDVNNQDEDKQTPTTSTDDDNKSEVDEQERVDDNEEPKDSEHEKVDEDEKEDNPETPSTSTDTPAKEEENVSVETTSQKFSLSAGTNKNVEISGSVITISNFTEPTDIALSFKIDDTQSKHKLQLEILSGNNVTFELLTSMLGLEISSIGSTTFRLSSLSDPSISQIFTIIVE